MRRTLFRLRLLVRSVYLSLILGRRVRVDWRVAELVVERDGYCPCRFGRVRCPCPHHVEELRAYGRCRCGLFSVNVFKEGSGYR